MRIISIQVLLKSLAIVVEFRQNMNLSDNDSHYRTDAQSVADIAQIYLEGASMIVCVCNNISDREIRQAVDLGLSSMAELRRDLGVATCCGKCASCAKQVLNAHLDSKTQVTELSFRSAQAA
jgi:bacterioferritin-associated ferredoxin